MFFPLRGREYRVDEETKCNTPTGSKHKADHGEGGGRHGEARRGRGGGKYYRIQKVRIIQCFSPYGVKSTE